MTFSINNANSALSLLSSVTANNGSGDLTSILYGGGQVSSGDPVASFINAETNQTKSVARQAKDPSTKRDVTHFLAVVQKAPDLKTLLADPIARKVFLTANGLGDQTDYAALATKALSSDTTKTSNLAANLSDTRWLAVAKTYDFANKGLTVLKQQTALDSITNGYAQVQWQQSLDKTTPGLSAALDFRSRASTITKVDQILGDKNIRQVVTTALGLPLQIAFQSLSTQEKAITDRLDITKFQNPKFVEQFARSFLVQNSINNQSSGQNSQTSLFA